MGYLSENLSSNVRISTTWPGGVASEYELLGGGLGLLSWPAAPIQDGVSARGRVAAPPYPAWTRQKASKRPPGASTEHRCPPSVSPASRMSLTSCVPGPGVVRRVYPRHPQTMPPARAHQSSD